MQHSPSTIPRGNDVPTGDVQTLAAVYPATFCPVLSPEELADLGDEELFALCAAGYTAVTGKALSGRHRN